METLLRTPCKMDSYPPARRPHKSPAHTVKDLGTGLSALFRPRHQSARGSRTSYLLFRVRHHLVRGFFRSRRVWLSVPFPSLCPCPPRPCLAFFSSLRCLVSCLSPFLFSASSFSLSSPLL